MTSPSLEREATRLAANPRFIVRTLGLEDDRKFATIELGGRLKWSYDRNAAAHLTRPEARTVYNDASRAGLSVTIEALPLAEW